MRTRRQLQTFIRLPWRLYKGSANWIPPLISERKRHLDRGRNPFFDHAEAEYFLAWRDGEAVGRITAHVDHHFNEFQGNRWGLFGFFESERDPAVAGVLLQAADGWLRDRFTDLGVIQFEDWVDTGEEYAMLDEVAKDRETTAA